MEGNKQFLTNWHERYNIEVFKLAINKDIPIIDITSKFLEIKNYSNLLCDDGIHPNEKGHKIIAEAIKEHIEKKNNLTQMQLAEKLNITDRTISKWKNGKGMPDSSIMIDLCNELFVTSFFKNSESK